MNTRKLGKTGYDVSEIGLGCWQLGGDFGPVGDDTASEILRTARSLDINFWDTADVYGGGQSESRIGAFKDKKGVLVATKLGRGPQFEGMARYTKEKVKDSLAGSIKRLGVETLDLAQLHCIPIDVLRDGEIFTWLDDMRDAGMIRHWGASVETIEQALLAMRAGTCTTLQIIFNRFRQDYITGVFPTAQKRDVGIIVRLPLASGLLSGKYDKTTNFDPSDHRTYNRDGQAFSVGETFSGIRFERGVELVAELRGLAPEGVPLSQFALRWILDHPQVSTVIAGVSKPEQIADNVAATERKNLFPALMKQLGEWYEEKVKPEIRGGV